MVFMSMCVCLRAVVSLKFFRIGTPGLFIPVLFARAAKSRLPGNKRQHGWFGHGDDVHREL